MYRVAYAHLAQSSTVALALTSCFVVILQVKINITNAYAGSIAWLDFFSRLTHSHPGRVVWAVFNIAIALLLMELGIYQSIEHTLVVYSAVAAAWVGALVAGLVINKLHGLSPRHIEFKRAHLYDVNPVGTGAMMLAVAAGILTYAGDVRPQLGGLLPFHRLWFGIPAGAPDRVENGWALLSGAQAAGALGETRRHLLVMLHARCALSRSVQAAGSDSKPVPGPT